MAFSGSILKESIKFVPKNGMLMALIAISLMVLKSCIFLLLNHSLKSLLRDMFTTIMQSLIPAPNTSGFDPTKIYGMLNNLRQHLALIFTIEIAVFLVSSIISFFFTIATVLVSAYSYNKTTLSIKDLFSILKKTWTRPLITTFYVYGLAIGYFFVVLAFTFPLLILYPNYAAIIVALVVWIASSLLYLYLVITWVIAVVVSVVEERFYGIEALKRAATLVKGNKLQGFLINFCFKVVNVFIFEGFVIILDNKVLVTYPRVYGLFVVNFFVLLRIWFFVAYTVLYFQCKEHHGEEIELHGSVQYTKLPTTVLINDV